ncbi:MAG: helix-turn-helix transcriptional regulator [Clostridia bacterium]|nr:helix-turn-helix transcriptional regulator [Clostridia bacterium]
MKSNKYKEKLNFLGLLIAEKRKSMKMSQNVLASKMQLKGVNIGKNDISKLETQNRTIKDYELIALKDILNIDLNSIHLD